MCAYTCSVVIEYNYTETFGRGGKPNFRKMGGYIVVWLGGCQEIVVFRLSDIASGAFLKTEESQCFIIALHVE